MGGGGSGLVAAAITLRGCSSSFSSPQVSPLHLNFALANNTRGLVFYTSPSVKKTLIYHSNLHLMACTPFHTALTLTQTHTREAGPWTCVFSLLWLTLPTYAGLSQCLMEEDTPPPQVLLHSPHVDQGPQSPSKLWGKVPNATHSPW